MDTSNIKIVKAKVVLEKFEKSMFSDKNRSDGNVLNVIKTEVKKLSSKDKFSNVKIKE